MESQIRYAAVGFFVLLMGTALIGIGLWLSTGIETRDYHRYVVYMEESVAGLSHNAPVKYKGVDVGRVAAIELDSQLPDRVRLLLDIEQQVVVRQDTVAVISAQGLTGIAFVDLSGGTPQSPPLEPSKKPPYPVIRSGPSLMLRLDNAVTQVVDSMDNVSTSVSQLLDEDNRRAIASILDNLETLSGELLQSRQHLDQTLIESRQLMSDAGEVTRKLPQLADHFDQTLSDFQAMSATMTATSHRVDAVVEEMHGFAEQGQQQLQQIGTSTAPRMNALLDELRATTESFRQLSQQLQAQPNSLLYGPAIQPAGPGETP